MFKWFSNLSLTVKLSLSILICIAFGMAGIGAFVSSHSEQAMETQILEAANNSVKGTIAYIGETISNAEQAVQTLSNTVGYFPNEESGEITTLLRSTLDALNKKGNAFVGVWLFTNPDENHPTGYLYYAFMENGLMKVVTEAGSPLYVNREWYQGALRDGKLHWGEPYVDDEEEAKPLLATASMPFKFNGSANKWDGVISVSFDLKEMQEKISNISFYESGRVLLLSKSGLYIAHPDPNIRLKMTIFDLARQRQLPELQETGERLARGETGVVRMSHSSVFGDSVIFFFAPVPGPDWGVCLVFSQTQFFLPLHKMTRWIMFASLIGLVALLGLVSYICRRSTAPLLLLSKAARQFGSGNFNVELPQIQSADEIGVLSEAFHKMRDSLQTHIEHEKHEVAEKQRRESELEIARQIQTSALPTDFTPAVTSAYEVFAQMNAAKEVGGDFYDFFMTDDNHLAVVIADVSGKGVPASLFMMKAKALIKNKAQSGVAAEKVFTEVNQELCQNNDAQMFVTAFMGILDIRTGQLVCVNAGHNPPLFKGASGKYEYLKIKHSLALGMMENIIYTPQTISMRWNDRIFFYTDGVTEAQNTAQEFYTDERLKKVLDKTTGSVEDVLHRIRADVDAFAMGADQADDITMLGLAYFGIIQAALEVPADIQKLPKVMDFLTEQMKKAGIKPEKINAFLLAAEEIFANIAHYAYEGKTGKAQIEFYHNDQTLTVRFRDAGKAFNPLLKEDPNIRQDAQYRPIGGLGIFLVKKSMDKVNYEYDNGENILTVQMKVGK